MLKRTYSLVDLMVFQDIGRVPFGGDVEAFNKIWVIWRSGEVAHQAHVSFEALERAFLFLEVSWSSGESWGGYKLETQTKE